LKFKESYGEREIKKAGGTYINLNDQGNPSTIEFLIVGNNAPNIDKLGVYISPPPAPLDLSMEIGTIVRPEFYWARFLIWGSILIVIFFVIYIILQEWYKRHYEKSLFKNPDDLYNLLNFIYNSRAAGLSDDATKNKLYDRKWKKEQVAYAFKKIDGKRTGMWEIPLFKLMEKNKVKRQIELKQGRPVDPRMFGQQWKTIQPRNINFIKRM
jgi:hypothetical protein